MGVDVRLIIIPYIQRQKTVLNFLCVITVYCSLALLWSGLNTGHYNNITLHCASACFRHLYFSSLFGITLRVSR